MKGKDTHVISVIKVIHFQDAMSFLYHAHCRVYVMSQGQASGMDGTLTVIFAISKTIRDSKKFIKKH